jgi:hypothetical protein
MKGFPKFIVVVIMLMLGVQLNTMAAGGFGDTNGVQTSAIVPPSSYIKVASLASVTNGVGGLDYIAGLEYYSSKTHFVTDCLVSTNLVSGPWVLDVSKAKYISGSHSSTGQIHYVRYRFFSVSPGLFYRPIMNEW